MLSASPIHREDDGQLQAIVRWKGTVKAVSPLVKNDHPELDDSELLDLDGIKVYQSLIGALQWVIQIESLKYSTR